MLKIFKNLISRSFLWSPKKNTDILFLDSYDKSLEKYFEKDWKCFNLNVAETFYIICI